MLYIIQKISFSKGLTFGGEIVYTGNCQILA